MQNDAPYLSRRATVDRPWLPVHFLYMARSESEQWGAKARAQHQAWQQYVADLQPLDPPPSFDEQLAAFRRIYHGRDGQDGPPPAWFPSEREHRGANLSAFIRETGMEDYQALHRWSTREPGAFWEAIIRRLGIPMNMGPQGVLDSSGGAEDPRWLPGATMNIVDACFRQHPDNLAVLQGSDGSRGMVRLTYGQLDKLSLKFAAGLERAGLREGDGVALYMPMNIECVAAYLGIVRAGLRVISIPDSFPAPEVYRRMELGRARMIVTVAAFHRGARTFKLFERVKAADGPAAVILPDAGGEAPVLRPMDVMWDDFIEVPGRVGDRAGDPYRVTNVLFSSGTTSTPKAIPWTQLTPIKCAMDGHLHQDIRPGDVVAWPTNIGWMMGPWLVFATLINGGTMALYEGAPTGRGFTSFVQRAEVTMLGVVPSLVRAWRASGAAEGVDWTCVRAFSSTGEPSSQEDYLWLMSLARFRAPVIEYCGGTEIGGGHITGTVLQPASPATFTTPALGLNFRLLGDGGEEAGVGEMGELFLVPPSLGMSQSLLNKDHHEVYYAGCPAGRGGEVLRRHGDQVLRLARGYFKAHGRADDAMNLGGIKVGSPEIERILDRHPGIYESAAVAIPPEGGGADRLVVFAVPSEAKNRDSLKQELSARLSRELNPLFKIHDLVLVKDLPRTASNKLMRRELRAKYEKG